MGKERCSVYYDGVYRRSVEYNRAAGSIYYPMWDFLSGWVRGDIFEVGCGVGQLASLLLGRGCSYLGGIDFSGEAIRRANGRHAGLFREVDLYSMDSYPGDTVVCTEVLEHLEDDVGVIRRLSPGQLFIFSVPNFDDASHVRHFGCAGDVLSRYSMLDIDGIVEFKLTRGKVIFLAKAVV